MGIENEIKQKKFSSEYHKLRVNVIHSASWMKGLMKDFLDPFDITQKQFNILRILRGQSKEGSGLAIQEIRERMIDKMSDASRLVDRLVAKGLIEKNPCENDKRHNRAKITNKGLELLLLIDKSMNDLDESLAGLKIEEAALLNELLDKMRENNPRTNK